MTDAEAIEAIAQRWTSEWKIRQPSIPFALQNEAFRTQDVEAFATVTIGNTTPKQLTQGPIGTRLFQYRGVINAKLYGPLDVGGQQLAVLAGDVRGALASQTIGGGPSMIPLHTFAASTVPGKEGRWATLLVAVPFEWHDRA